MPRKSYASDYRKKVCLVTGGAGFIGQNIVNALLKNGASVYVLDDFSNGVKKSQLSKKVKIISGDVRDNKIFKELYRVKLDYCFHFVGPSSVNHFDKDLDQSINTTISGFLNVIQYCSRKKTRLVYASSTSVYGGAKEAYSESAKVDSQHVNNYARSKLMVESIAQIYSDCSSVGLRIAAGYGPDEHPKDSSASVVYLFSIAMLNGQLPIVYGDGKQERDFIFIDDMVNSILILAQHAQEPIVNIGSGTSVSFNQLVGLINKILNTSIQAKYAHKPKLYLEKVKCDTRLLRKYVKTTSTPLQTGVKKVMTVATKGLQPHHQG